MLQFNVNGSAENIVLLIIRMYHLCYILVFKMGKDIYKIVSQHYGLSAHIVHYTVTDIALFIAECKLN